jgi:2-amino-4-hydroxy-6-hydroxymethyldihydropteridine diphosphokinase
VVLVDQPSFLNMVAELSADIPFSAEQVLARLLRVEYALGRSREVPMGPRTIDLDLLLYGEETRATELLTLPHPRLHLRRFVLTPLVELCPTLVHPTFGRTISDLLQNAEDTSDVRLWNPRSQ